MSLSTDLFAAIFKLAMISGLLLFSAGCTDGSILYDHDNDGVLDQDDCAPDNPYIHPGMLDEACDGIDTNCDGHDGEDGEDPCGGGDDDDSAPSDDDDSGDDDDTVVGDDDDDDDDDDTSVGDDDTDSPDLDGDGVSEADGDCDDTDPNVFPGQTAFFVNPTAAGSYDFDCDGGEELEFTDLSTGYLHVGCTQTWAMGVNPGATTYYTDSAGAGWCAPAGWPPLTPTEACTQLVSDFTVPACGVIQARATEVPLSPAPAWATECWPFAVPLANVSDERQGCR